MTFLIARHLSEAGIPFVELSGKVPVKKRQALIDEFTNNPECRVFLSTDAGGTGLNLQAADCVVNFELPWNPAKMNQRIGRVSRIGQKSKCINVVNFICKGSMPSEEIPEDTPHFLNPEVLKEDQPVDFAGEEGDEAEETVAADDKDEPPETRDAIRRPRRWRRF